MIRVHEDKPKKPIVSTSNQRKKASQNQRIQTSTQNSSKPKKQDTKPLVKKQTNIQKPPEEQRRTQPKKGLQQFKLDSTIKKALSTKPTNHIFPSAKISQFKIHLDNTQNVFYEESTNVRLATAIRLVKPIIVIFFVLMVVSYIFIGRIVPYPPEKCPKNAVCKVFIHCNQGYILKDQVCIIDPELIMKAQSISTEFIQRLSYTYGNNDCLGESQLNPISMNIKDLLTQANVQDNILLEQIHYFLINKENQQKYGFKFNKNLITPTQKQYSLSCYASLFILSYHFKYYVIGIIAVITITTMAYNQIVENEKANKIYQFLKRKTYESKNVSINQSKRQGQRLFGPWTNDLWQKIDQKRFKDGRISFYVESQETYWKKID